MPYFAFEFCVVLYLDDANSDVVIFCCFWDALMGPVFLKHIGLLSCGCGKGSAHTTSQTTSKNANTNHKEAIKTPLKQRSTDAKLPEQPTSALIPSSNQPNHVKKRQHEP
jgi:hypothetical protein